MTTKRKQEIDNHQEKSDKSEESSDEEEIVNVDFDYFDPKELDFEAIKNLLRQLLDADNTEFNVSFFADEIIKNSNLGSTIKTDGPESDPFAVLSVLDVTSNKDNENMKKLIDYFISKTQENAELNRKLRQIVASDANIGLLICERLINMPVEVIQPMYRMLKEQLENAGKSFDFLILPSKTYYEQESQVDMEDSRPAKKGKKSAPEEYYFHVEDELLHDLAISHASYPFNTVQQSDSKRTFQDYGIYPRGHLILFNGDSLESIINKLATNYPLP